MLVLLLATQCTQLHDDHPNGEDAGSDKDAAEPTGGRADANGNEPRSDASVTPDAGRRDGGGGAIDGGGICTAGDPQCDAGPSADDAGDPPANSGIAVAGARCAEELERACSGHAAVNKLICMAGVWVGNGTCDGDLRCDTMPGATQGTCQTMVAACVGKNGGDEVCDATERRRCDLDLLRYEANDCPTNRHCAAAAAVSCVCDVGYQDDGAGGCTNVDDCASNACGVGATDCIDGVDTRTCTCAEGYDGSGAVACTDTDECTQSNVCSDEYPCNNIEPGYFCRGEFAEWPMPDSTVGARTAPSYTVTAGGAAGGTVVDNVTGLMWQRHLPATTALPTLPTYPGCTRTPGGTTPAGTTCTFAEAESYCAALTLAGHSDWRLPTKIELESIVDVTRLQPAIDDTAFPATPQALTWTSSAFTGTTTGVMWAVEFVHGFSVTNGTSNAGPARCVR